MTTERNDDWTNIFAGGRGTRDKAQGLRFERRSRLSRIILAAMYEQDATVATIVDKIVDDAINGGWKLVGTDKPVDPKTLSSKIDDCGFDTALETADKWSNLYGGALIVAPTTDVDEHGTIRKPDEPLGKIQTMYRPFVVAAHDAVPLEWDDVFGSDTYHKVLSYSVTNSRQTIVVHHSRCHVFEPIKLDPDALNASGGNGWGPSVIERCFSSIARYGASLQHGTAMMYVASILAVHLDGYRMDYKAAGGPERLRKYMTDLLATLDSKGLLGLDANDKISATSLAGTGAADMIDRNRDKVAADAQIPKEILFKESPAGLNAGQLSGPQEIWNKDVASHRHRILTPAVDWFLAMALPYWGFEANEWEVEWAPLWEPTETSKADNAAKWATIDKTYHDMGAIDETSIGQQRFVDGNTGALVLAANEPVVGEPMDLTAPGLAVATPEAASPADEALNGAQLQSVGATQTDYNTHAITYTQACGRIALGFPRMRGREHEVLGPPPPQPDVLGGGLAAVAPAPGAVAPVTDEPDPLNGPSDDPIPPDAVSPQEAAAKFRVHTRTITRMIDVVPLRYWGLGKHKRVSLADIVKATRSHESPPAEVVADADDRYRQAGHDFASDWNWMHRISRVDVGRYMIGVYDDGE